MAAAVMTCLMLLTVACAFGTASSPPPHVVIIIADDLGWNDVSFHGSNQFLTPNLDALAFSGVVLQDYYTQPLCTPSRAALFTGRHPINNGMEHDVIYASQPWGLPLSERVLPQHLAALGYAPHAVGKWHLGFCRADYTPTRRGFLSHYGTWCGNQDHYTYMRGTGYDFHRGLNASWEAQGKYTTDVLTEEAEAIISRHDEGRPLFLYLAHAVPHAPLQAPPNTVRQFNYIKQKKRRTFAGMVTKLDESVGRVVQALSAKGMLDNTIILFISDNGGATHGYNQNVASNWPLKGGKDTLWEGGVRAAGFVWSPLLRNTPRVHRGLVSVQDWLPTLLAAANRSNPFPEDPALDGVSQWEALSQLAPAPYQGMLHNIDPVAKVGALRDGPWKVVYGTKFNGRYDGHFGKLPESVPYDVAAVLGSAAGRAVQASANPLPEPEALLALRAQATLSCNPDGSESKRAMKKVKGNVMKRLFDIFEEDDFECRPKESPCLYNIEQDPCETQNLAGMYPSIVTDLMAQIKAFKLTPPNNKRADERSDPSLWNNTWTPWLDFV